MTVRRILIGVTGGIAAYKSAELVRLLKKQGHEVQVVMTEGAKAFITPLSFQALSGRPVRDSLLDPEAEAGMGHIELARWAELLLVAPATADFLARLHAGLAGDLLSTLCLATQAPVIVAPAMNQAMWRHPATQRNVKGLSDLGLAAVWGPAEGEQACGDVGPGRMLEAVELAARIETWFAGNGVFAGQHVVITAGPTQEAIDPVRYISNHSSGKMGFALAEAAVAAGAKVTLICGPVSLPTPTGVVRLPVRSAADMLAASESVVAAGCDIFIAAAAVADYRSREAAQQKIKKSAATMSLELTRNPDIVATIAARADRPYVVGFAAETTDVLNYARRKREAKQLDMIIANDVSRSDIGFGADDNAVTVITATAEFTYEAQSKRQLAQALIAQIAVCRADTPKKSSR